MAPLRGCTVLGLQLLMLAPPSMARLGNSGLGLCLTVFLLLLGLGLSLMMHAMKQAGAETPKADCYRWGVFYVNPEDPAVWVPKRLGMGWTLNFAHGRSWAMLGLLLLPVLLVMLLALSS